MQQMFDPTQIKGHVPVVSTNDVQVGTVDHLDAKNTIKLTRDQSGQHHWIPLSWVTQVDTQVHVDRSSDQAMREWSTRDPNA
jgi:hypothetical protein